MNSIRIKKKGKVNTRPLLLLLLVGCSVCSCKNHNKRNEIIKIVNEWAGKEILFPENVPCYAVGKESSPKLCDSWFQKEFKILLYVDSSGCSDCRLRLFEWKQLMETADSLFQGKVGFLLFFQPKSVREMAPLFARDRFDYPVFMDVNGTINHLNDFPKAAEYQCFLLNKNHEVLMVGNPVLNRHVWELYKLQIDNKKIREPEIITTIHIDKAIHDYGITKKGSKNTAVFTITNTGNQPLVINHVSTSCGCINVEWERQAVDPGQTANIRVEIIPDETGYFSKAIDVYCNTKESPLRLKITGNTNE